MSTYSALWDERGTGVFDIRYDGQADKGSYSLTLLEGVSLSHKLTIVTLKLTTALTIAVRSAQIVPPARQL